MLVLLAAVVLPRIAVEVPRDHDPCAFETRVPAAIARWMPETSTSAGSLALTIEANGDAIAVTMTSTAGRFVLRRTLPYRADACDAAADAVALVVERHFRDLGWVPEPVLPPPPSGEGPAPPVPQPSEPPDARWSFALGGRGIAEVGPTSPVLRMGGALEAAARLGPLDFGLEGGIFAPSTSRVFNTGGFEVGEITVWSIHALAGAGGCLSLSFGRYCAAARGGLERVSGTASGDGLFQNKPATVVHPLISAAVRYEADIAGPVAFSAGAEAFIRPLRPSFVIEDAEGAYQAPVFAVVFGLGGRVKLF